MIVPKWLMGLKRLARNLRHSEGLASKLTALPLGAVYLLISRTLYSFDVPVGTDIGRNTTIHHGIGLVIHRDAVIGADCVLRQCTTIGERGDGRGAPTIGNRVEVGANCVILGEVRIGDDAIIGAGSVVINDVLPGERVAGVPARPIGRK